MLVRQLWQLSEAGDPAFLLGRPAEGPDRLLFQRLLEQGVLRHAGRQTTWDTCEGCDCGRDDRPVRWLNGSPVAICIADHTADLVLSDDDLLTFELVIPELVSATAEASGFADRPEEVALGIWRVGAVPAGGVVYIVPTRYALRRPGLVGSLRQADPMRDILLLGHSLDQGNRAELERQGIYHVILRDCISPPGSEATLTLNLTMARSAAPSQIRLRLHLGDLTVAFDGRVSILPPSTFKLLALLVERLQAGQPIISTRDIHSTIFSPSTSDMRVRGLMRELRDHLSTELRAPRDLVQTRAGLGYLIGLSSTEVIVER